MFKFKLINFLACAIFFLLSFQLVAQKDTEFWFVAPEISQGANNYDRPVSFWISTYGTAATVTLSQPANPAFVPQVLNLGARHEFGAQHGQAHFGYRWNWQSRQTARA